MATYIERDWQVFAQEGAVAIGAVRQVGKDRITIYIEGFGDIEIGPGEIASVHDSKVVIDPTRLPEDVRGAIAHAHDREERRSS